MFEELVVALLLTNAMITLWVLRQIAFAINHAVADLDQRIANALTKLIQEGSLTDIEPINPIQAAIAEMLTSRMKSNVIDVPRSDNGKFSKQ
jgi:hypothetical protein